MPRAPRQGRLAPQHARVPDTETLTYSRTRAGTRATGHPRTRPRAPLSFSPSSSIPPFSDPAESGALSLRATCASTCAQYICLCTAYRLLFSTRFSSPLTTKLHFFSFLFSWRPSRSLRALLNSRRRVDLEFRTESAAPLLFDGCYSTCLATFYKLDRPERANK